MARQRRQRSERATQGAFPLAELHERPPPPLPWLRWLLGGIAALAVLTLAALGTIRALIDTAALQAQAEEALRHATGREVRVGGKLSIQSYFGATVALDDIAIANRPGAAVPDILRIARAEAELSLLSLLGGRAEIQRLVISGPEIALEIDAQGRGNWRNDAGPIPAGAAPTHLPGLPRNIHLKDGKIAFADARSGRATELVLRRLTLSEGAPGGLLALVADLAYGAQRFSINGQVGPLSRLADSSANAPWPLRLTLDTQGTRLTVAGGMARPLELAGYAVKADLWVADSSTLAGVIPYRLPVMRTLSATARIADIGGSVPDIAAARVQIGASDFSAWVPGLKLDQAELTMPALDSGARATAAGTLAGVPLKLNAAIGPLSNLLVENADRQVPFPVDATLELGETVLTARGGVAALGAGTGLDIAVAARVRDLEQLSALAGRRLPPLRNMEVAARLRDGEDGGFARAVALRDLRVTAAQGDLAGDVVLGFAPRWSLRGRLAGAKLDADALAAVLGPAIGAIEFTERESRFRRRAFTDDTLFSAARLRLDVLHLADADLTVAVDDLTMMATPYRRFNARLQLAAGRLELDPLRADLPAGRATVRLVVDAADPRVPMLLQATIPGIPVQPLLAGSTRRDNLFGPLEIDADLTAAGDSPRAIAASLSGRLGLAIVEGDIDSRMLLEPLGGIMTAARMPMNLLTQMGTLARLRCFAARIDATDGQAKLATALLESGRMGFQADGELDLAAETMVLRLRSFIRLPNQSIVVPAKLDGPMTAPRMALEPVEPPRAGPPAPGPPPAPPDLCGPALELARAGRDGPAPAARDARPNLVTPQRPAPRR